MSKGEKWRRRAHRLGLKLEAAGKPVRARAMFLAVILDAKLEARADG